MEVMTALPSRGWTMLAASTPDREAIAPVGQDLTMFTGALAHVLAGRSGSAARALSFADIANETGLYIQLKHGLKAVLPQCHTPRQDAGNLAFAPLFMNGPPTATQRPPSALADGTRLPEATALFSKGVTLGRFVAPFGSATGPALREEVAKTLFDDDFLVGFRQPHRPDPA